MARCLGVVSDTHGFFDPTLATIFAGVERIVHGGDVVGRPVLDALARIAPVDAIVGNCDRAPLTAELPEWRVDTFDGTRILVVHDLGTPERIRPAAAERVRQEQPRIVVSGHSHKGQLEVRDGILFVNPGSAGKKRFRLLRSAAVLAFGAREIEARLISLEGEVGAVVATARLPRPG